MSRNGLFACVLLAVPVMLFAAPVPKQSETPAQKLQRLFGEPILPDESCKADLQLDVLKLTAGGIQHVWHAGADGMKVPFLGREVTGDFAVSVMVKAVDLPESGTVTGVAGLFVMKDATLTLDHSLYLTGNSAEADRRGWLRATVDSDLVTTKEERNDAFTGVEVALKVERVGTKVTAYVAPVGKPWVEIESYELALDKSAKVGVFVAHTGGPFTAEFREFRIVKK